MLHASTTARDAESIITLGATGVSVDVLPKSTTTRDAEAITLSTTGVSVCRSVRSVSRSKDNYTLN